MSPKYTVNHLCAFKATLRPGIVLERHRRHYFTVFYYFVCQTDKHAVMRVKADNSMSMFINSPKPVSTHVYPLAGVVYCYTQPASVTLCVTFRLPKGPVSHCLAEREARLDWAIRTAVHG